MLNVRVVFLAAAASLLTACATSGTSVLVGEHGPFAPTNPETIRLLVEPPQVDHMVIALVEGEASTDDYFTKARTEAAAINAMKKEAARIGAHAIVLTGKGSRPYGQVSVGNTVASGHGAASGGHFNTSAYATSVSSSFGWEKYSFSGTAVRYKVEPAERVDIE